MKRKILKLISGMLTVVMIITVIPLMSTATSAEYSGDFIYRDNGDGTITLTGYTGNLSMQLFEIPSVIDGKTVTRIGNKFCNGSSISAVSVPDTVKWIGDYVFNSCKNLITIVLPDNLEYIGYDSFYGSFYYDSPDNWENGALYIDDYLIATNADMADEFKIKDGTKLIANGAFAIRNEIKTVIIPDSVNAICQEAFPAGTLLVSHNNSAVKEYAKTNNALVMDAPGIFVLEGPSQVILNKGINLNTAGMKVIYYDENFTGSVLEDFEIKGFDPNKVGKQTVTISANGYETQFSLAVSTNEDNYINFQDKLVADELLLNGVDKNEDGLITISEMEQFNSNRFYIQRAYSLRGLEYASNVSEITCQYLLDMDRADTVYNLFDFYNLQIIEGDSAQIELKREVNCRNITCYPQYVVSDSDIIGISFYGMQALKEGNTSVTVKIGGVPINSFNVSVISADMVVGPETDTVIKSTESLDSGILALYDNGELYHIDNEESKLLSSTAETCKQLNAQYIGDDIYTPGYALLESGDTLKTWIWDDENQTDIPYGTYEDIVEYTDLIALNIKGEVIDIAKNPGEIILENVKKITSFGSGEKSYALTENGDVYAFAYDYLDHELYATKSASNISDIIGGFAVKDNKTYLIDVGTNRFYVDFIPDAVDYNYAIKGSTIYRYVYYGDPELLSDNFESFYEQHDASNEEKAGYIATDGYMYSLPYGSTSNALPFPEDEVESIDDTYVLKTDGTLWKYCDIYGESIEPILLLNEVTYFRGNVAVRSDGSVWQEKTAIGDTYYASFTKISECPVAKKTNVFLAESDEKCSIPTVRNVRVGTSAEQVISELYDGGAIAEDAIIKLYDTNGEELAINTILGTGMIFEISDASETLDYRIETNHRYTVVISGEVNGDGKITAVDARWALQIAAGIREATPAQRFVSEINNDKKITAIDARWILQIAAGIRSV